MSNSGCGACADNRRLLSAPRVRPRVLVCIEGAGQVEHGGSTYAIGKGDVLLLPAAVGAALFARAVQ